MPGVSKPTAVANSGEDVIYRKINDDSSNISVFTRNKSRHGLNEFYEIDATIDLIKVNRYKNVALQFPDFLMSDSSDIYFKLSELFEGDVKFYVLADTSYGSCCVDEVAAQHVNADFIVHYGTACMTPTDRIPVQYVFGLGDLDIDECSSSLKQLKGSEKVVVMYDVIYEHAMASLFEKLSSERFILSKFVRDRVSVSPNDEKSKADSTNRYFIAPEGDFAIVYIGSQSLTLSNIIINHNQHRVYSFDPKTNKMQLESSSVNKILMRRYQMVQKTKDANVIGICVGTLGAARYLDLIERLQSLIEKCGKKSYLISVGKLSPVKLGNFLEIEAFVFVACPEQILVDGKRLDFYQPVVTPWELQLALEPTLEWSSDYKTGIIPVLRDIDTFLSSEYSGKTTKDEDIPYFSLASGQLHSRSTLEVDNLVEQVCGTEISIANKAKNVIQWDENGYSAGARFLKAREWQGLSNTEPVKITKAVKGRVGVASKYTNEN